MCVCACVLHAMQISKLKYLGYACGSLISIWENDMGYGQNCSDYFRTLCVCTCLAD